MISKILFVEDTIALANIVKQELQTAGFSVLHTASGKEALRLHAAEKTRPGHPGLDAAGHRRVERAAHHPAETPPTPVIMVTAKSEEIDKILGLEIGGGTITSQSLSACAKLVARIHAIERRIESVALQLEEDQKPAGDAHHTGQPATGSRPTIRFTSTIKRSRSAAPNSLCCTCFCATPTGSSAGLT